MVDIETQKLFKCQVIISYIIHIDLFNLMVEWIWRRLSYNVGYVDISDFFVDLSLAQMSIHLS